MTEGELLAKNAERLVAIENRLESLETRLEAQHRDMLDRIDGGPTIQWERSVRGRLHTLEADSVASKAAAAALAEAQRERRKATEERVGDTRATWRIRIQVAAVAVAVVAVAAPYLHYL